MQRYMSGYCLRKSATYIYTVASAPSVTGLFFFSGGDSDYFGDSAPVIQIVCRPVSISLAYPDFFFGRIRKNFKAPLKNQKCQISSKNKKRNLQMLLKIPSHGSLTLKPDQNFI